MTELEFIKKLNELASNEAFYRRKVNRMSAVYNDMIFDRSISKSQCAAYALRMEDAKESWVHVRAQIVKAVVDYFDIE